MKSLCVKSLTILFLLSLCSSLSYAAIIVQNFSVAEEFAGWNYDFSVDQFDPSLGTLNSVSFTLTGEVRGDATITNLGDTPEAITVNVQSELTLQRPDTSQIVQSVPLVTQSTTLDAAGGANDSQTWSNQVASSTPTSNLSSAPDLALFTGLGSILLPILSAATSSVDTDGSATLVTNFTTWAAANLTVTYNYTSAVPEPATVLLLGSGLAGLIGWRRKQKAADLI